LRVIGDGNTPLFSHVQSVKKTFFLPENKKKEKYPFLNSFYERIIVEINACFSIGAYQ